MNHFVGVGRLTRDPEIRTTGSDTAKCNFTLAINRPYKNRDGEYDADFPMCTAWRQTAEFINKHFQKGDMIGVYGSVQTRNYDDKDGKRVYVTEINVERAYFVGSKSKRDNYYDEPEYPSGGDNDLPFDF
jgi:single-strand DNA-binding protein